MKLSSVVRVGLALAVALVEFRMCGNGKCQKRWREFLPVAVRLESLQFSFFVFKSIVMNETRSCPRDEF